MGWVGSCFSCPVSWGTPLELPSPREGQERFHRAELGRVCVPHPGCLAAPPKPPHYCAGGCRELHLHLPRGRNTPGTQTSHSSLSRDLPSPHRLDLGPPRGRAGRAGEAQLGPFPPSPARSLSLGATAAAEEEGDPRDPSRSPLDLWSS